ncbi:MAG: ferritin [Phycisphaerae bacterium]
MLSKKIEAALNKQLNHEMTAFYHYLAMEAWFEEHNLSGFANWMRAQGLEELEHCRRIFKYVSDRGGAIDLQAIGKPPSTFKSPRAVFAKAAELETDNTRAIHAVYALAVDENDYATQSAMKWFIDEQVEEEKTTREIEALLAMAGDNQSAMLLLNSKLGERAAGGES